LERIKGSSPWCLWWWWIFCSESLVKLFRRVGDFWRLTVYSDTLKPSKRGWIWTKLLERRNRLVFRTSNSRTYLWDSFVQCLNKLLTY
jgi:hypothetical protein